MSAEPEIILEPGQQRPNGSTLLAIGWTLVLLGVLSAFVGFMTDATTYSGFDADAVSRKVAFLLLGGALLNIGMFLAMGGLIIRAIWFLPARPWVQRSYPAPVTRPASPAPAAAPTVERPTDVDESEDVDDSNRGLKMFQLVVSVLGLLGLAYVLFDLSGRLG